ncbi:MAG: 50S ribosomal protein L9 [Desulfobacterales bacterium]|nr:50S ribosomal protein L9 [Desulfobacterales bacterium]
MKLILTQTIESLGIIGSEVEVKPGYARNFLLPQQKARASPPRRTAAAWSRTKPRSSCQIAKERKLAEEMAQKLDGVVCPDFAAKVAEEDRLYGSVTVRDIIDAAGRPERRGREAHGPADRAHQAARQPTRSPSGSTRRSSRRSRWKSSRKAERRRRSNLLAAVRAVVFHARRCEAPPHGPVHAVAAPALLPGRTPMAEKEHPRPPRIRSCSMCRLRTSRPKNPF